MDTAEVKQIKQIKDDATPQFLLSEIAEGNKLAEEALVAKYWKSLFYIIDRQSKNPDLAADLTQDALFTVIKKARKGDIQNPDALTKYIHQVGKNMLIAHYRKENRRQTDIDNELIDTMADQYSNCPDKVNSTKLLALVEQVIDELPVERDKELIRRFYLYDNDKARLCQDFNLSSSNFDSILFRARSRLKLLVQHKLALNLNEVSIAHLLSLGLLVAFLWSFSGVLPSKVGELGDTHHYTLYQYLSNEDYD